MIDNKTIHRNYPLPDANNTLKNDVFRIRDSFEQTDIDINDLYNTSAGLSTQIDSLSENISSGSFWQGVSTGNGTAYDVALTPPPSSLNFGLFIHMKAHVQNTGPATLNVNSLGAKTIIKSDGSNLKAGDISTNALLTMIYDGSNFQLLNPKNSNEELENVKSNLFRAFEEIQENHGGSLLMEAGWSDSFSNSNEQGADEASSTGYQYDPTNKLYKGTDPETGLNTDQDFTTEVDYEFYKETLSDVSITGGVVTLNSGILTSNINSARAIIGANEAIILSRDSDTQFTVESGHSLSGTNVACEIWFHQFKSGKLRLNDRENTSIDVSITTSGSNGEIQVGASTSTSEKVGQSATTTQSGTLHSVEFKLKKIGSPTDNYRCEVYGMNSLNPTYPVLATSDNVNASEISTSYEMVTFRFSGSQKIELSASTEYGFLLTRLGTIDASNHLLMDGQNTSVYSGGRQVFFANNLWQNHPSRDSDFVLNFGETENVTNKYIPIYPKYSNLVDPASWSDENSMTQTETLNSANIWYFEIYATNNYGANTILKITDGASGNIRSIAQNNAGTWEYNTNPIFASTSWTSATSNSMTQAIIDAMGISVNQMTGIDRAATPDTAILIDTSKKRGTGVVLNSTINTNNPEVEQTRITYDTKRGAMDLISKTYNPDFVPSSAYVWSRAEHSDNDGPGTFSVSRNGGIEWTVVPMAQQGLPLSGNIRILRGTVDISEQISGQDIRCRYQTTQGKNQFLHSWGLQGKS